MLKAYSAISDFSVKAQNMLRESDITLDINNSSRPDEEQLVQLVNQYDILIIGAKERMTDKVYSAAKRLKIIGTLSIGLDHISESFMRSERYRVINTPNANVVSVAEHTIGLMLALKKRISEGNSAVQNGTGRSGILHKPTDISGCTLGLIGAGRIARQVQKIAQAFNMRILCYTFHPEKHEDMLCDGVQFMPLEQILCESDVVSIHMPLSSETEKMIGAKQLMLMKKDSTLINTSRASIVDIPALLNKADAEPQFCVGLDIDVDGYLSELAQKRGNVIVTPHIAGISQNAVERMDIEMAENLISCLSQIKATELDKEG